MNDYYTNYTLTLQEYIVREGKVLFDFDYTSVISRTELERRFINKYYFREIGYETYSMWKFKFKERWVNMIKHYNKLFEVYKDIDPELDFKEIVSYVESVVGKDIEIGEGSVSGTGQSENNNIQRDTPITEFDTSGYVSFVGKDNNSSESQQQTNANTTKDVVKDINKTEEKRMLTESQLKRLNDYVKGFMDIIDRFLNEFYNLFMLIY